MFWALNSRIQSAKNQKLIFLYNGFMNKKEFGTWAEDKTAEYFLTRGYKLIDKNVHYRCGEIDLILEKDAKLLFVEVKARRNENFGVVVEALTTQKLRKIQQCIGRWRKESGDFRPGFIYFVGLIFENGKLRMHGQRVDIYA